MNFKIFILIFILKFSFGSVWDDHWVESKKIESTRFGLPKYGLGMATYGKRGVAIKMNCSKLLARLKYKYGSRRRKTKTREDKFMLQRLVQNCPNSAQARAIE